MDSAIPAGLAEHAEGSLSAQRADARACTRCDLHRFATQVVHGEGPEQAAAMLVGEQPGDAEDRAGRPFVGPAGRLLDDCLAQAGIKRDVCYVTNAVKHFKFVQRGKKRLHARPNAGEIRACAWWLGGEIARVRPRLIVALGATATASLLGRGIGVSSHRGRLLESPHGAPVLVTVHPSCLLRLHGHGEAAAEMRRFIADLARIAEIS